MFIAKSKQTELEDENLSLIAENARLRKALECISGWKPNTCELTLAHDMADVADEALARVMGFLALYYRLEKLEALEQAAREFVKTGTRTTPDGMIVREFTDDTDPYCKLCEALEAIAPLNPKR